MSGFAPRGWSGREIGAAATFGAVTGLLGALGGAYGLVATLALLTIALGVRTFLAETAFFVWLLAAGGSLGTAAGTAGGTYPAQLFAGVAGLLLVAWIAASRPRPIRRSGRLPSGLLLPGLVVAVALTVPFLLPAGPDRLGIAVAVLVALLAGLAAAIGYSGTDGARLAAAS